ncbi:MAG TPA: cytochrome c oxidase assembly protein [Stellaceae bacterium]|nr:cytochrome c oxidase assembly protein [Stellaceae bacterium]
MHLLIRLALVVAGLVGGAAPALAHAAEAPAIGWSWDPPILASLAVAALGYAAGAARLHRRLDDNQVIRPWQMAAYGTGLAMLFVVLVSPIDAVAEQLFWVHMVQHLALLLAAAPLLVMGRPAIAFLWAFGPKGRRRVGRLWGGLGCGRAVGALMHRVLVWLLFCGAFIVWHFPGPYQAALRDEGLHTIEHLCFLVTALMFWSIVIEPSGRRRLDYGATIVFVATAAILSGLPGALIALAPRPLYPIHAAGDAAWGLSLLEDQQLAGIVMWIPGGVVYIVAVAWLFLKWLEQGERRRPLVRRAILPALALCLLPLLLGGCNEDDSASPIGNARRGAALIQSYGCGGCHTIPGIGNADGLVGPPLDRMGRRIYIAGLLRNIPDNMIFWLRQPQSVVPGNAMPDMGLSESDARDVAAYLYTLQ